MYNVPLFTVGAVSMNPLSFTRSLVLVGTELDNAILVEVNGYAVTVKVDEPDSCDDVRFQETSDSELRVNVAIVLSL